MFFFFQSLKYARFGCSEILFCVMQVVNEERVRKDFESSVDVVQEITLKSRIRGTEDWEPPRFQIIFNVHPPLK